MTLSRSIHLCAMSLERTSDLANENMCEPSSLSLDLRCPHNALLDTELGPKGKVKNLCTSSPKSRLIYANTTPSQLLNDIMGGVEDEVSQQHLEEERARNQENEQVHNVSGSNAKWLKEGQNQLRKVAEKQQDQNRNSDQNLNLLENENENPDNNPNQNRILDEQDHDLENNKNLKVLCSEVDIRNAANEPLLINTTEVLKNKEQEYDEEDDDDDEEESLPVSGGEKDTDSSEAHSSSDSRKGGDGGGRNRCLLFSKNGAPSDEDSSCMSLSQGSTTTSTPDGDSGNVIFFYCLL